MSFVCLDSNRPLSLYHLYHIIECQTLLDNPIDVFDFLRNPNLTRQINKIMERYEKLGHGLNEKFINNFSIKCLNMIVILCILYTPTTLDEQYINNSKQCKMTKAKNAYIQQHIKMRGQIFILEFPNVPKLCRLMLSISSNI